MEEKQIPTCACGDADYMVLSYSGVSDVGFIADHEDQIKEFYMTKLNGLYDKIK